MWNDKDSSYQQEVEKAQKIRKMANPQLCNQESGWHIQFKIPLAEFYTFSKIHFTNYILFFTDTALLIYK